MYTHLAPVVLFVYNRLQHTQTLLSSLEKNPLCSQTDLFIFADAKGKHAKTSAISEVHQFINNYKCTSAFRRVTTIISHEHKGLANSIIPGVSKVIKKYGKVIVLEDDLIVSEDFLLFMNEALDFFEKNKKIWSIAGYTPPLPSLKNYSHDLYLSYRASSWGWATWLNRWQTVDWKVKNYPFFKYSLIRQLHFNRGGNDLSIMLSQQMDGEIDSWAIRWCYAQSCQNKYTVYPAVTKIKNCGFDGTGTHCKKNILSQASFPINKHCSMQSIKPNKKILREFKQHYKPNNVQWLLYFLKLEYFI